MEIRREKWALVSRLSDSFKVTETDVNRSETYDFLLMIHSNYGPILYLFRDIRRLQSKIANTSDHMHGRRNRGVWGGHRSRILFCTLRGAAHDHMCI